MVMGKNGGPLDDEPVIRYVRDRILGDGVWKDDRSVCMRLSVSSRGMPIFYRWQCDRVCILHILNRMPR